MKQHYDMNVNLPLMYLSIEILGIRIWLNFDSFCLNIRKTQLWSMSITACGPKIPVS